MALRSEAMTGSQAYPPGPRKLGPPPFRQGGLSFLAIPARDAMTACVKKGADGSAGVILREAARSSFFSVFLLAKRSLP